MLATLAVGVSSAPAASDWSQPNADARGTRAVASPITSRTVHDLRVRWRYPLTRGSRYGSFASTALIAGGRVYAQDLSSSVTALDARTGRVVWTYLALAPTDGPNGLSLAGNRIFGATDTSVFALDRRTGRRLWARRLANIREQFVDIAPLAGRGLVFTSTIGFAPGGRGALYALDQRTGVIRWRFQTVRDPWQYPSAGGGGAWYTPSLAPDGSIFYGISNPTPWGGSPQRPNGGMYPGPVPYTDSLLALGASSGKLRWYDQVTKHDVRDYDFEASPIVAGRTVFGAGKAGRVVAWDRVSGRRRWARMVGTHLHDLGPLPNHLVKVCPGLWGGVLSPMSYALGRLFVPVVERCMQESAQRPARLADLHTGDGVVVALAGKTGRQVWSRRLGSPPTGCTTVAGDVVFAPTLGGTVFALSAHDGRVLWRTQEPAGINGCPSVAGDLLVVGAGAPSTGKTRAAPELTGYGLSQVGP